MITLKLPTVPLTLTIQRRNTAPCVDLPFPFFPDSAIIVMELPTMTYYEVLFTVLTAIYTVSKAYTLFLLRRESNLDRLLEALEVGVHAAWEQVLKPWLSLKGNEKPYPPHLRLRAEEVALRTAERLDPIVKTYPPALLRTKLKMTVEQQKNNNGI